MGKKSPPTSPHFSEMLSPTPLPPPVPLVLVSTPSPPSSPSTSFPSSQVQTSPPSQVKMLPRMQPIKRCNARSKTFIVEHVSRKGQSTGVTMLHRDKASGQRIHEKKTIHDKTNKRQTSVERDIKACDPTQSEQTLKDECSNLVPRRPGVQKSPRHTFNIHIANASEKQQQRSPKPTTFELIPVEGSTVDDPVGQKKLQLSTKEDRELLRKTDRLKYLKSFGNKRGLHVKNCFEPCRGKINISVQNINEMQERHVVKGRGGISSGVKAESELVTKQVVKRKLWLNLRKPVEPLQRLRSISETDLVFRSNQSPDKLPTRFFGNWVAESNDTVDVTDIDISD